MDYVIIKIGNQQYKAINGQTIDLPKLPGKVKDKLTFDKVLLTSFNDKITIGKPLLSGVKVKAELVSHFREPKIRVAKFRAKSRYRKVHGHRQTMTRVRVIQISLPKAKQV